MKILLDSDTSGERFQIFRVFRDARHRPAWHRYGLAIFWMVLAFGGHWLADPYLGEQATFSLFSVAVLIIAWSSGAIPALLSLLGSIVLSDYFFLAPRYSLGLKGMAEWWSVLGYVFCTVFAIFVIESLHRSSDQLRRQQRETELEVSRRRKAEVELDDARQQLRDYALDLERAVRVRTSELSEAVSFLENFCYSIAHDLRAPARAVNGFSALLRESAHLNEEDREWVERICKSTTRMDTLITALLDYGRLSHTATDIRLLDLDAVVEEALIPFRSALGAAGAVVEINRPLASAWCDHRLVQTILRELIKNAMEHAHPAAELRLAISTETRDNTVRLQVSDNGIGVPRQYQKKIFGLFQTLSGPHPHRSGAGLAIVAKAAERMHGSAGVEPGRPRGAAFWIELPRFKLDTPIHPRPNQAMTEHALG